MLVTEPLDAAHLVLGIAKAGAVSVNINPRLAVPEIAHILNDSGARMLVFDRELSSVLAKVAEVAHLPDVADFTHSQFIEFIEEIPRNASGKVLKTVLRDRFGSRRLLPAVLTTIPSSR
jgi:acyl-CoA synthetase (AMP-forming)/AMP-acid ligase II